MELPDLSGAKNVLIDDRMASYRSFFDHDWAVRMRDLVRETILDELVFNLCAAWKGAAKTHEMPWLTVELIGAFADGFVNAFQPPGQELINALLSRFSVEMREKQLRVCESFDFR